MNNKALTKKVVLIIAVVIIFAVAGFGVAYFLTVARPGQDNGAGSIFGRLPIIGGMLKPAPPTDTTDTTPPTPDQSPLSSEEQRRLIQITDESVIGPAVDNERQRILYHKKRDGHLFANAFSGGREETVSNLTILNILDVIWAPNKKRSIVIYQDGETLKKFSAEATSSPKIAFLPQESQGPAWSPDGNAIFWMTRQNQNYTLTSSSADGRNIRSRGFTTATPDLQIFMLTTELAALIPKTASFFETPLFILNTRALTQIMPLFDFGLTVSSDDDPKTQLIAYAATTRSGELQELHILDAKSGKDTSWPIKTLPEKCAFAPGAAHIFCAVPRQLPYQSLPEARHLGQVQFSDAFFRLDLASGRAQEIFNEGEYDAVELVVSNDSQRLFFVDQKTGFLYGLSLE